VRDACRKGTAMAKSWEKLTIKERVEVLRDDLRNMMTSLNLLIEHQNRLGERFRALESELVKLKTTPPHTTKDETK
jgi:hypothetical protein